MDLRIAIRNLFKYRRYTFPNIMGLSISVAALLVILQFLSFELSFDRFHKNRICRVINTRYQEGEQVQNSAVTYSALGPALVQDFPEVINQTRIFPFGNAIVRPAEDQNAVGIRKCVAVEQSFLDIFDYQLLAGDRQTALTKPNQLVLTETTAQRVFSHASWGEMIGQIVKLDNDPDSYEIVAIIQDLPENSHLSYQLFMSYETIIHTWGLSEARFDWNMVDFRHYVQLSDPTNLDYLNTQMGAFSDRYFDNNDTNSEVFRLQPIEDIYLSREKLEYDGATHGHLQLITTLLSLGVILFVVSWINFINLNGALLLERRKSMGIQKVLGISQKQIWKNQSLEIGLVIGSSIIIGFGLSAAATFALQSQGLQVKGLTELVRGGYLHPPLLGGLFALLLAGALLTLTIGIRFNTRMRATGALRATSRKEGGFPALQRVLLIFQFVLSIVAFSTGMVIFQQQQYVLSHPLGVELDHRWVLQQPKLTPNDTTFKVKLAAFKRDLSAMTGIQQVATNQRTPGQQLQADYDAVIDGQEQTLSYLIVDQDYLPFYNIDLLAGRNFQSADIKRDLREARFAMVNQEALKAFGVSHPADAIGKRLIVYGAPKEVIGVVGNFRQLSLQHDLQPTVFLPSVHSNHQIVIQTHLSPTQWLGTVKDRFLSAFPGNSFEYRHLEDEYFDQYASIADANKAFGLFTMLSMMIALFGMLALASLNLIARLKEISIRKILGASDSHLFQRVLRRYLINIAVAAVISGPIAYRYAGIWLDQFQSRIPWSPLHFVTPVAITGLTVAVVLFLVTYRSLRVNPVEVLRSE